MNITWRFYRDKDWSDVSAVPLWYLGVEVLKQQLINTDFEQIRSTGWGLRVLRLHTAQHAVQLPKEDCRQSPGQQQHCKASASSFPGLYFAVVIFSTTSQLISVICSSFSFILSTFQFSFISSSRRPPFFHPSSSFSLFFYPQISSYSFAMSASNVSLPTHFSTSNVAETRNNGYDTTTSYEQSRRQVSSVVVSEQFIGDLPESGGVRYVEVRPLSIYHWICFYH